MAYGTPLLSEDWEYLNRLGHEVAFRGIRSQALAYPIQAISVSEVERELALMGWRVDVAPTDWIHVPDEQFSVDGLESGLVENLSGSAVLVPSNPRVRLQARGRAGHYTVDVDTVMYDKSRDQYRTTLGFDPETITIHTHWR